MSDDILDGMEHRYRLIVANRSGSITSVMEARWTDSEGEKDALGVLRHLEYQVATGLKVSHNEEFRCTHCSRWDDATHSWKSATFGVNRPQVQTFWNPHNAGQGLWPTGWDQ